MSSAAPLLCALASAARQGNSDALAVELAQGTAVDTLSPCGWTPLADAARCGHSAIIRQLIAHGADLNSTAYDGSSPLMFAARHGHTEVVEILLASGADPLMLSSSGCSAFEYACQGGHPHIARRIFTAGATVSEEEALVYIRAILVSCGLRCTLLPARSRHPPRWAVDGPICFVPGDLDPVAEHVLHTQISKPTPLKRLEMRSGTSFQLHMPALPPGEPGSSLPDSSWRYRSGWSEPAQAVLHGELAPNRPDQNGFLPLLEAARRGHSGVVRALIEAGADPNTRPRYGLMRRATLLMNAAEVGATAVIEVLIEAGADLNAQSATDWTALMTSASRGHLQAVQILANAGANLELRNAQGKTALNMAIDKGFPQVARALIVALNRHS